MAQIAYGLLPRDVFISVEQRTPGNLDPDEWAILRRVIDLIQANAKGAELGPVLETIENALRADQGETDRGGMRGGAAGQGTPNDDPTCRPLRHPLSRPTRFNDQPSARFRPKP